MLVKSDIHKSPNDLVKSATDDIQRQTFINELSRVFVTDMM